MLPSQKEKTKQQNENEQKINFNLNRIGGQIEQQKINEVINQEETESKNVLKQRLEEATGFPYDKIHIKAWLTPMGNPNALILKIFTPDGKFTNVRYSLTENEKPEKTLLLAIKGACTSIKEHPHYYPLIDINASPSINLPITISLIKEGHCDGQASYEQKIADNFKCGRISINIEEDIYLEGKGGYTKVELSTAYPKKTYTIFYEQTPSEVNLNPQRRLKNIYRYLSITSPKNILRENSDRKNREKYEKFGEKPFQKAEKKPETKEIAKPYVTGIQINTEKNTKTIYYNKGMPKIERLNKTNTPSMIERADLAYEGNIIITNNLDIINAGTILYPLQKKDVEKEEQYGNNSKIVRLPNNYKISGDYSYVEPVNEAQKNHNEASPDNDNHQIYPERQLPLEEIGPLDNRVS